MTTINDIYTTSYNDLKQAVQELGFLPFFACSVPGFSIEEHVAEDLWYSASEGWQVWDWKGPLINDLKCGYGKFFDKKAVYARQPAESYERILDHLTKILPGTDEKAIRKLLK